VFEYFGEGQVGHMRLRAGNRAIAEHSAQSKDLLLFRNTLDGLRFEGEMVCEGYHVERAPDRTGAERDAIVFELRSLEAVAENATLAAALTDVTLEDLRQRALTAAAEASQPPSPGKRNIYQRSRDVRLGSKHVGSSRCHSPSQGKEMGNG
jgi:5-methylcytosine-specific restriction protein A